MRPHCCYVSRVVDANSIPARGNIKYYGQFILITFLFEPGLGQLFYFFHILIYWLFFSSSFLARSPMVFPLNYSFIAIGHALSEYVCMLIRHSEAKNCQVKLLVVIIIGHEVQAHLFERYSNS